MRTGTTLAATVALLAGVACTPRMAPPVQAGRRIFERRAIALAASPDGSRLAWLADCAFPDAGTDPPAASSGSGRWRTAPPVRVAEGVAPAAGSFAWNVDGSLLALARRDPASGAGDLVRWRPGAEPHLLAPRVTAFAGGPGGRSPSSRRRDLHRGWSRGAGAAPGGSGALRARLRAGARPVRALAARARGAGGSLVLLLWRGASSEPVVVARDVGSFAFSPDGAWLAAVVGVVPGTEGTSWSCR